MLCVACETGNPMPNTTRGRPAGQGRGLVAAFFQEVKVPIVCGGMLLRTDVKSLPSQTC